MANNADLEVLVNKNSNLSLTQKNGEVILEWSNQEKLDWDRKIKMDSRIACFLLKELDSFQEITLLGNKSVLLYGNELYAIAGSAQYPRINMDKSIINAGGVNYELTIGPLNPVPTSIINKYGISTSLEEIKQIETIPVLELSGDVDSQDSSVNLSKEESTLVWRAMLFSLLLAHIDPNHNLTQSIQRNLPTYIASLSSGENYIIKIKLKDSKENIEINYLSDHWDGILNYIIFEYYRSQGVVLRISEFSREKMKKADIKASAQDRKLFPDTLIYRPINSLLVEYIRVAEETNSEGFKYLSYFHILEHFFRDSVLADVSEEIKKVLLGSDFIDSPKDHTSRIVHLVIKMFPRGEPKELDALKAVLNRFLPLDFMEKIPEGMKKHFDKVVEFDGEFSIPGINTKTPNQLDELGTRIYRLRNSIVHSKENFGEGEGHIILTKKNKRLLIIETELIKRVIDYVIKQSEIP